MLILYWFGRIIGELAGDEKLLYSFVGGGLLGGVAGGGGGALRRRIWLELAEVSALRASATRGYAQLCQECQHLPQPQPENLATQTEPEPEKEPEADAQSEGVAFEILW